MERKVGEVFEIDGVRLKVVAKRRCFGCYFAYRNLCFRPSDTGSCASIVREDKTNVVFMKI